MFGTHRLLPVLLLLAALPGACVRRSAAGPPPGPSPSTSTVAVIGAATVVADGTSTAVIEVTVRDADGRPLAGRSVAVAASGAANTIVQPAATAADGRTQATLASTVAESKTTTATVGDATPIVLDDRPTVTFTADAANISAALSSVVATPGGGVVADGSDASVIEVTVRDRNGNVVPGQQVALAASGSGNVLTQPGASGSDGRALGALASLVAEPKTVTATINPGAGAVVVAQQPTVSFIGDASNISDTLSSVLAVPASGVVADGVATSVVTVTVRDGNGNAVAGQTVALAATGTANTIVQPGASGAGGIAAGSLASTRAETKTVTATVNPGAGQVVLTQQPTVGFVGDASNVSSSLSTVVASPLAGLLADGVAAAAIDVTVVDVNGNPLAGQTVQLAASGLANAFAQPGATAADGRTSGALRTTRAERKTLTATVDPGGFAVVLTQQPVVRFVWPLANTFYVRASGDDGNDGTSPARAWRTLARAASSAAAGATVVVGAGTWTESLQLTASGTAGSPIRWLADRDGALTGDAGDVVIDGGGAADTVFVDGANHVRIEGFTIRGASTDGVRTTGDSTVLCDNRIWGNGNGIRVRGPTAWASAASTHRRRVTFGTAHSLLPTGFTAAFALDTRVASTNVALASGDDVRVFWQPVGGAPLQLDRIGSAFDSAATTIEFRLQSDVPANLDEDNDGSYFVYYGDPLAGAPPREPMRTYWFGDSFDRPNSTAVGNGWTEWNDAGDIEVLGGRLVIKPTGDANPPQVGVKQSFALGAIPGDFTVSLTWTMPPNNEGIWSFWGVNVGTASAMTNGNRIAGVGVGLYNGESLGLTGVEAIDNDMSGALENGINGTHTFRLVTNRAAFAYDYWRDGAQRATGVPFANAQPVLDQFRIGADNFGYLPGEEQSIDDLKIVLNVADAPETAAGGEQARPAANGRACVIEDNAISNNPGPSGDGIVLDNAANATVRDNTIYNNGRFGVAVLGTSTGVLVAGNTLYRNGAAQIRTDGAGNQVTVTDNAIADGLGAGLEVLAGTSAVASNYNDVFGNTGANWSGLAPGANDFSADPRFEDPDGVDNLLGGAGGADDRFQLGKSPPSPCFDAGSTLAASTPFVDRTSRLDGVLDGTSPDGATLNVGRHFLSLTDPLPALETDEARLAYAVGARRQPLLRTLSGFPPVWSAAAAAAPAGSTVRWLLARASPAADDEELFAVFAEAGGVAELDLLRWNGVAWSVDWTAAVPAAGAAQRGFDLAYEAQSADALAVWSDGSASPLFRARRAGAWSAPAPVFATPPGAGAVAWIVLAARPGSDEIALVFADLAGALHAVVWDGDAFAEAASEITLSPTLATVTESRAFDVAYETVSGDLLVLWGHQNATEDVQYAVRPAAAPIWSVQTLAAPARAKIARLAAEPGSDRIAAALSEGIGDTDVAGMIWDGSAWTAIAELDASAAADDREVAVAWVGASGTAVLVYKDGDGGGALDVASWDAGSGWVVGLDLPFVGMGDLAAVALRTYHDSDALLAVALDDSGALWAAFRLGLVWTLTNGGLALQTGVSSTATAPFDAFVRRP